MRTKYLKWLYLFAFIAIFFSACKEKEEEEPDSDIQAVIDNVKSEEAVSSTFNTVNHYGINEEGIKGLQSDSLIVTVEPCIACDSFPKTLTLDFGSTGILCEDGIIRKGKIISIFTGRWGRQHIINGTNATITFDNFYVNNIKREGQVTATYTYDTVSSKPTFTIVVENLKVTYNDNMQATISGTRTFKWEQGFDDLNNSNDIFYITGSMTGTDVNGRTYTTTIIDPLIRNMTCTGVYTFTAGKVEITPQGKVKRTIDFGDGVCDNIVSININGLQRNYTASP
ncbi:MAG: hypothetical protein HY738_16705 [Bacteroidia bacterium]|nr:hypothetical protein [Bacteroidia bacterium]